MLARVRVFNVVFRRRQSNTTQLNFFLSFFPDNNKKKQQGIPREQAAELSATRLPRARRLQRAHAGGIQSAHTLTLDLNTLSRELVSEYSRPQHSLAQTRVAVLLPLRPFFFPRARTQDYKARTRVLLWP